MGPFKWPPSEKRQKNAKMHQIVAKKRQKQAKRRGITKNLTTFCAKQSQKVDE